MAYHRARKTGLSFDWDKFKRYRNPYKSTSRSLKKAIFKEATDVKTNDPAKLRKTVKSKISPNANSSITKIVSKNKTLDSFVDNADVILLFLIFKDMFRVQISNLI